MGQHGERIVGDGDAERIEPGNLADIAADPHYRARGTVREVDDPEHGRLLMAAPLPHMSETPGSIRSLGPELGSANQAVYGGLLGMTQAEIERLREDGVI